MQVLSSSKSHCEISFSCIFWHQVYMKNIFKCLKYFFMVFYYSRNVPYYHICLPKYIQTIVSKIDMRPGFMYGLIGKRACWSYFCYMSMGVREWLRWWVAFLGGLLLCQERYWALQEYAHFGLYNRQITKLSEWPMLEWTLSTTFTALHNGQISLF